VGKTVLARVLPDTTDATKIGASTDAPGEVAGYVARMGFESRRAGGAFSRVWADRRLAGTLVAAAVAWMLAFSPPARAATFYVNSTADTDTTASDCNAVTIGDITPGSGTTCTLWGAIETVTTADAATPGANSIVFIVCGPFVITSQLPDIPGDTTIDGTQVATTDPGCYDNGALSINYGYANVEGSGSGPGGAAAFPGLKFDGSGSTMIGLIIGGFTVGVQLGGSGAHHLYDSGIGSNPFEQGDLTPENSGDGIEVLSGSANDVIGYSPADGENSYQDDIYGNGGWGVALDAGSGPTIVGHNFIGTDTTGHEFGPGTEGYTGPTGGALPGNGPSDGNGAGGVYVGDSNGDVIGGSVECLNVSDVCDSNVISGNGGPGVELAAGSSGATVASNYIGESLNFYYTPPTGQPEQPADGGALPNHGAGVQDAGTDNTIGGTAAGAPNLISGNSVDGILLEGSHANVEDNLLGLNFAGTGATPNIGAGILASDAGGVVTGANRISGNVIGGNTGPGIQLDQAGNSVVSNAIGTAGDRTSPLANSIGILADRGPQTIGAPVSGANVIAHNTGAGIAVVDPSGSSVYTTGVGIFQNSIFGNGGLGIDLGDDGVTQNHPLDSTAGPNNWQNFPVLATASAANGQYSFTGTLAAAPNTYYTVYVYGNTACDPSGYGQGETPINGGTVSTDSSGHANFALTGQGVSAGTVLSATAIAGDNSTSEFGPCLTVGPGVDLTVSQAVAGGGKVIADEPVDVVIHVANTGPATATNVVVIDTLPQDGKLVSQPAGCPSASGGQFSCSIGDLAPGASDDLHILLQPGNVQTLTNTVTVSSDQVQTNSADDTSLLATAVAANPNEPGSLSSIGEPAPTFGQYVLLARESGQVTATLPNGQVIQLANFALVPVGTVVQTSDGVAQVTDALPGKGKQTTEADFKYGRFKISQARTKRGLLNAVMNGSLSGCSPKQLSTSVSGVSASSGTTGGGAPVASAAGHRPTSRRLWGHDAKNGNFTITGNRGAATVRGTTWEVVDTCTTTTVKVSEGVVDVTGIGNSKPRNAIVRAGQRVVLRAG
jgi:hypothetical protein